MKKEKVCIEPFKEALLKAMVPVLKDYIEVFRFSDAQICAILELFLHVRRVIRGEVIDVLNEPLIMEKDGRLVPAVDRSERRLVEGLKRRIKVCLDKTRGKNGLTMEDLVVLTDEINGALERS